MDFISEGTIKRGLIGETFDVSNSMDENLRSKGYRLAINEAFYVLNQKSAVIIDASFHQSFRRKWVYETAQNNALKDIVFIWIYCYCDDISLVQQRIEKRAQAKIVTADIQARSMDVYTYTMRTFDKVDIKDFPEQEKSVIIYNNTSKGYVEKIQYSCNFQDDFVEKIIGAIYG